MTIEIKHRQVFEISAETYWRELCLNLDYQERLYREALGCERMEVLENHGSFETGMRRRLRFTKPIDAPAAITKLFGRAVCIEEHSEFDAAAQRWTYRMLPPLFADRIEILGRIELGSRSDGVEQLSHNTVSCRLFGLGSVIELFVARSTEQGHADKAAFTRRYLEERALRRRQ